MENKIKRVKKTPKFKTAEVVTLVLTTCVVSLLMGMIISKPKNNIDYKLADEEIQNFISQYNYIVDNYIGDVDKKKLIEAALEGMVNSLDDPYSKYINSETSSTFNAQLNGSYNGIGIQIVNDKDNNIIVTQVFEDTPAAKAGIQALDIIKSVNGKDVSKKTTNEFVQLVKDIKETNLIIELQRNNETKQVKVIKQTVTLNSVFSELIEKNEQKIGYIAVSIFAMNTDSQFKTKLKELEKQKINSLIIDLRGNSGGHLTAVEEMISLFLDDTKISYQIQNKEKTTKYYSTGKETKKYPIVILIDNDSASASEMMAAALKESYGATLIGKTTYGKGTVQELQDSNQNQYKITTKKWLTPNGNWINEKGIKPDIEIELDQKYFDNPTKETDNQLQKALEYLAK